MVIPSSEPMPPPPPQNTSKPPAAARRKPTPESSAAGNPPPPPPPPLALRCPRCDSANTKFCYYNNYSLSQPRHFCKSCRRYWTKGGSLRSIPIGGGCRKTKKPSSSSAAAAAALAGDLKLFHGISSPSSSSMPDNFPPLNLNPFVATGSNLMGLNSFNFPFTIDGGGGGGGGSAPTQNMASSIESLSAQNLELHWKLQQQRMSLLYGGETDSMINLKPPTATTTNNNYQKELHHEVGGPTSFVGVDPVVVEKPQPIYFQNLEAVTNNAKPISNVVHPCGNIDAGHVAATEWFFDGGSYGGGRNSTGNGKEEESNINGKNATNSLNDDGSCGAQGWADDDDDDDDQFHHFNGLV